MPFRLVTLLPSFALLLTLLPGPTSAGPAEGKAFVLADFARAEEGPRWQLGNSGPKSKVETVAGPDGVTALQVTCVYEPRLAPQAHSPAPYMTLRRAIDGEALARENATRLTFWHRGHSVQVVFSEKERGDCYHHSTGDSQEWRRVAIPFPDLRFGWNQGGKGKGEFDLARMEAVHLAVSPAPGETRQYAIADLRLERAVDDLDPRIFIGSRKPARVDLYPKTIRLPVNRTQPILVVVANEERCGLAGVPVELALSGPGSLVSADARVPRAGAKSLRLETDAEGKARALYQPPKEPSARCALAAAVSGTPPIPAARAEATTAPAVRKVHLGPAGFFAGPDGRRVVPLGGLFLPWWGPVEGGALKGMSPVSILGASEAEQDAWFAYLKANGVNYVRGYWPWGAPLKIGHGGAEVRHVFDLDGKINEPVIAALERMMADGGRHGIGFSLTIADCARHFLGGYGYRTELPAGKTRRRLMHEAEEFLRELVPRLAFNPNVWAYELTNEQGGATYEWSDRFIRVIKELDPVTPVMVSHGGGALQTADPLPWMTKTRLDVYQPHHYPSGHALFLPEVDAGLAQEVHYNAMAGPKSWLLGESGGYGTHPAMGREPDGATQEYLARDCIWFALLNRSIGASIWGIKHHATTQFRLAAEIAREIDWPALARAKATVGVAVPRGAESKGFFGSEEGRKALRVMADYARWSLCSGVTVDFVPDAAAYAVRRSALEPFDPPEFDAPLRVGEGYQVKYRMSADGKLVVAYVRNVARIALHKPEAPTGSRWKVTGSYIRVRQHAAARLQWRLPGARYDLVVWDLDTGERMQGDVPGPAGSWGRQETDHDFVLMWRQR